MFSKFNQKKKNVKRVGRFEPTTSLRSSGRIMLNVFLLLFLLLLGMILFDFGKAAV